MSLHYLVKLETLIVHVLSLNCYQQKLQNSSHCNCGLQIDDSMSEILQEKVYKTRITDLELSTTPLTNGCRNDDMSQLGPLQSLFQFVQISDAYFVHLLLQQSSHTV